MMQSWRAEQKKQSTNALLLLTIFNHASWSTLHIASRYLQVYAKPITFDGQGVLSSTKGFAALFSFFVCSSGREAQVAYWQAHAEQDGRK